MLLLLAVAATAALAWQPCSVRMAHRRLVDVDEARAIQEQVVGGELQQIDLRGCDLSREAAQTVLRDCVARCGPHSLCRTLVLDACAVRGAPWSTLAGAGAFTSWLAPSVSLRCLALVGNALGDTGCEVLAEARA